MVENRRVQLSNDIIALNFKKFCPKPNLRPRNLKTNRRNLLKTIHQLNLTEIQPNFNSNHLILKIPNVVLTTRGSVRGSIEIGRNGFVFTSFRGIPYAKPPIGNLRFRNPRKVDEWTDIRLTTLPRPSCLARDPISGVTDGEEDCLYLDIYSGQSSSDAALQDNLWPVMVIFSGVPRLKIQPRLWILRHVVVVVAHHRLQVLGFLSRDDECSTPGLMDQMMALQWVHENIIAFGGDPDNVTIAGEGESGSRVAGLIRFPAARGLFTRVGIFSAPLGITSGERDATHALASRVDCPPSDVVSCFERLDARVLVERQRGNEFVPVVNLSETASSHVPCVIGVTSEDGVVFLRRMVSGDEVEVQLKRVLRDGDFLVAAVKAFYGVRNIDSRILLDSVFYAPALKFATNHAQYSPTYLYELTFKSPGMMQLLFGDPVSTNDVDERVVMDETFTLWINFITTGNPSPSWHRVTSDPKCYEINVEPKMTFSCRRHFQSSFWNALQTIDTSPSTPSSMTHPSNSCSNTTIVLILIIFIVWTLSLFTSVVYLLIHIYYPRWKSSLAMRFPRLGRWMPSNA